MAVVDLWTARDAERAARLKSAADAGLLADGLFAIEGADEAAVRAALATLDGWGAAVRARVVDESPAAHAKALADVLGGAGLAGDRTDYHAVAKSELTQVIARRTGMPILLSSVWILVGERAGLRVDGVGLPGHFVARVGGDDGVLVDPFRAGLSLELAECRRLVRAATGQDTPWDDAYLRPCSVPDLLERVLHNLARSHEGTRDLVAQHRVASLWCALRPSSPQPAMRHATLTEALGARESARAEYGAVIERFPGSPEARAATDRLARMPPSSALN